MCQRCDKNAKIKFMLIHSNEIYRYLEAKTAVKRRFCSSFCAVSLKICQDILKDSLKINTCEYSISKFKYLIIIKYLTV